jgi:hypothetical protein
MRTIASLLIGLFLLIGALTAIVLSAIVQAVLQLLPLLVLVAVAVVVVKVASARRRRGTEPQRVPAVPTPPAVAPHPSVHPHGYGRPRPPTGGWVLVPVWMVPSAPPCTDVIDGEVLGEEPGRG